MNCQGLFGRLLGHKYEVAYNTSPPEPLEVRGMKGTASGVVEAISALTNRTVAGIYCARCGDMKKPDAKP